MVKIHVGKGTIEIAQLTDRRAICTRVRKLARGTRRSEKIQDQTVDLPHRKSALNILALYGSIDLGSMLIRPMDLPRSVPLADRAAACRRRCLARCLQSGPYPRSARPSSSITGRCALNPPSELQSSARGGRALRRGAAGACFWPPSWPTARTPPHPANLRETASSESARTFF